MNIKNVLTNLDFELLDIVSYDEDVIIFHEGELCDKVGYVLEGEINIVSYSSNGDENIISIVKENEFFANALIFSNSPYYLGEVIVEKGSKILFINKDKLISLLQNNKDFLLYYLNKISKKTVYMSSRNKLLSIKNIRERILYYLDINKGVINISITNLSKELIIPRPSISREISKMIDEGIILKNKKLIKLRM